MSDSTPSPKSGRWRGFYMQGGRRYGQDLVLEFRDGVIRGEGLDPLGRFFIRGRCETGSEEIRWTKSYVGAHTVAYRGFFDGRSIWGLWEIPAFGRGGFRIWPEGLEESAGLTIEAEADAELVDGIAIPHLAGT
ncbi:MAG: hypothetical protein AB7I19_03435 [Planctomycetota bacterium]